MYRLLLLSLLLSFSVVAQAPLDSGNVPFRLLKNAIVVTLEVEGEPCDFILDTGGTFMISKRLQEKFAFPEVNRTTVSDINKNTIDFVTVEVPKLTLGTATFNNRKALVSTMSDEYPEKCFKTDGMIGRDFFEDCLLHFDYENGYLRLTQNPLDIADTKQKAFPMEITDRGLPAFEVELDGQKTFIEFDSGSGDLFSFKTKQAKKKSRKKGFVGTVCKGVFSYGVSGKDFTITDRYRVRISEMKIGNGTWTSFYSDLSKPSAPRVGATILLYGRLTLDYKKEQYYFEPYPNPYSITYYHTFGFALAKIKGQYQVKWVLDGSPAQELGIGFGTVIQTINGKSIEDYGKECDTYLFGFPYEREKEIEITFLDAQGQLQTAKLQKLIFE